MTEFVPFCAICIKDVKDRVDTGKMLKEKPSLTIVCSNCGRFGRLESTKDPGFSDFADQGPYIEIWSNPLVRA